MTQKRSAKSGKKRQQIPVLLVLLVVILVACNFPIRDLSFITHSYPTLDPAIFEGHRTPSASTPEVSGQSTPPAIVAPEIDGELYHVYAAQSGDSLPIVAIHFGVSPLQITSPAEIPVSGIIPPGQYLIIPKTTANKVLTNLIMPDSAVIDSPCADDFDISAFVQEAGGYLSRFSQSVAGERISGADVVKRVADNQSINPRLLLAIIEYRAGIVYGNSEPSDIYHPLKLNNEFFKGLYQELSLAARMINAGYYGWRYGGLAELTFKDEVTIPVAPNLNAGSVGIQNLFANLYTSVEWEQRLAGDEGFIQLYLQMFGDFMPCAMQIEPLLTDHVIQPQLELPFAEGEVWAFTAGPHYSWVEGTPHGALDFAPNIKDAGCIVSPLYARAPAAGVVTRSDNSVVMLTLVDTNGQPNGWEILFMHIATQDRVALGTRLSVNDTIGHPSCEGGSSTGTHMHIARKYKGEWISTSGPLPFVMSGWTALPGERIYTGTLVKDDLVVNARQGGNADSLISR